MSDFAHNLRFLCAREQSVSKVCRKLGINRQQFARYVSGASQPSPYNLRLICLHFEVSEQDLHLPREIFERRFLVPSSDHNENLLMASFPGDARGLRKMVGSYHTHFCTPSEPGKIFRAFVRIEERDGQFLSTTIERMRHTDTGQLSRARFVGLVSMHDEALFMVERGRLRRGDISETSLAPAHRGTRTWYVGMLLGFSWRLRKPYSSPCVWKRLRPVVSAREALSNCGIYDMESRAVDSFVREHLNES